MLFNNLRKENRMAFIGYMVCGYPNIEESQKLLSLIYNYVDLLEVGFPFSDPVADGEIIQNASQTALENGITLKKTFEIIGSIKKEKPIVLMLYANIVFKAGLDNFFRMCKESNVDGVIIPDVPFEEKKPFELAANKFEIYLIDLVSISSIERAKMIASNANGFIYSVSKKGTTGFKTEISPTIFKLLEEVKKCTKTPVCVGFGIKDIETAKKFENIADGIIVGSALIDEYEKGSLSRLKAFLESFKMAFNNKKEVTL